MIDFTLPELGENVTSGDVLRVLVKAGDLVARDQPVVELETDKATIEVPSSVAGVVKDIKVKPGDRVKVGQVILTVDEGAGTAAAGPAPPKADAAEKAAAAVAPTGGLEQRAGNVRASAADTAGVSREDEQEEEERTPRGAERADRKVVDISRGARTPAESAPAPASAAVPAPAAPSVRRLARELGIDINEVPGSGSGGRISIEDVKAHAKRLVTGLAEAARAGAPAVQPLPDFSRWGEVERQPMRAVRRKTAEHLSAAWASIPHVTQHDLADITATEELRTRYAKQVEAAGGALTITVIALKAVASALRVFPQFNASVDMAAGEIVYKKYVHVGVAVDTDRGLLVPVIRDADRKSITELAVELAQLSEKARTRKIALDEMQGGCFSVSNLGGIGGTSFTPIVNAPEVAILGISRARTEPVYQKDTGQFAPRLMLPLSLSYDHRVIDGADGVRFVRWVAQALEQPFLLALQG
ncbi:MAG: 2-oxo acid dehydrogenase subunit E2 [Betaproteobacteria bacterium]